MNIYNLYLVFVVGVFYSHALPTDKKYNDIEKVIDELGKLVDERIKNEIDEERRQKNEQRESDTLIDNPENINPDDPLENLLEGMTVEENGKQHKVQGIHPEKSSKTYGDTHDGHRWIPEQLQDNGAGQKRNFVISRYLWDKAVIPYEIHSNVSASTIATIYEAIKDISDTTCVKWIPQSDVASYGLNHNNFVRFVNSRGCWSYVGNVADYTANPDNIQEISIQEPGCTSKATVIHEMLHAMGGHHEQSRADRNNYVDILYDNIRTGSSRNFNAQVTDDHNPYDAESALQYSLFSFSGNGQKTIQFKDQRLEFLADSADGLEFYDIQDITDSYRCTADCSNPPSCQNGGYVNFQCVCVCPDGLSGATCTDTVSSSASCGGVVSIGQGEVKYIQSPNYQTSNYPTNLECTWLIKGTTNNLVRATVEYMDIAAGAACYHWLEYRYNLLGQRGPKRCGTNLNAGEEFWDSTTDELSNAMMIKFNSKQFSNQPAKTGFRLKLENIGTGCVSNPCVYGTCTSPEGTSSYTCTCNPGVSGLNCDVVGAIATIGCTFEYGEKCFLDNDKNDQFDWSFDNDGTPSGGTGPSKAKQGYQFVYIETSSGNLNDKAVLVNNVMTLERQTRCLTFYYHMYGSSVGTLKVFTQGQNVPRSQIFSESGNKGNIWKKAELDIPAMDDLKIYIEGVRGSGNFGDIGLDDIILTPGTCDSPVTAAPVSSTQAVTQATTQATSPVTGVPISSTQAVTQPTTQATSPVTGNPISSTQTTIPIVTTGQPINTPQTCTFEKGASCFMEESKEDNFDWRVRSGKTPTSKTGPNRAFEGSNYKYIEVSNPTPKNAKAALVSSNSLPEPDYCLMFAYHMKGKSNMGKLKVSTGEKFPGTNLLTFSGNKGDNWKNAVLNFKGSPNMKLYITANKAKTSKGDIAIDDLRLYSDTCDGVMGPCFKNPCKNSGTCTEDTSGYTCACPPGYQGSRCEVIDVTSTNEFRCDFETSQTCIFTDATNDNFNWTRRSGKTPTSSTGPDKAYSGKFYMYTEVSAPVQKGQNAVLTTTETKLPASNYCLSMAYHRKGCPGPLFVYAGERGQKFKRVWRVTSKNSSWKTVSINIPLYTDPVIKIEGKKSRSSRGDVAIDDIVLKKGSCS